MKRLLLLLFILFPFLCNSQIIAGVAPSGSQIVQSNTTISAAFFSRDSMEIDLDCDLIPDIKFLLVTGNPSIDAPHSVYALSTDTSYQLCSVNSTAPFGTSYLNLFVQNDTMICDSNHSWSNITVHTTVASSGGFLAIGPHVANNLFFAYKKKLGTIEQDGWIEFSLTLQNTNNPFFTINSYTTLCGPNSREDYKKNDLFKLYPSVTQKEFQISSAEKYFNIDILNQMGQRVYNRSFENAGQYNISISNLPAGHYFVRYESEKGSQVIRILKN